MRFRKLRIAWSVVWGILAVLLLMLWVRSYWWFDNVNFSTSGTEVVQSFDGVLGFVYSRQVSNAGLTSMSAEELASLTLSTNREKMPHWYFSSNINGMTIIKSPHWFVTLLPCILVAVPWIHWRF